MIALNESGTLTVPFESRCHSGHGAFRFLAEMTMTAGEAISLDFWFECVKEIAILTTKNIDGTGRSSVCWKQNPSKILK
jgi:hypothetical protein